MDSRDLEFRWQSGGYNTHSDAALATDQSMTTPALINLQTLIDEQKCYKTLRQLRWPEGVTCSKCGAKSVVKRGFDETQPHRQRYQCQTCRARFDESDTIFAGHHQPLQTWILCLYLMGLNLSTHQIAAELDLNKDDVQLLDEPTTNGHRGEET